MKKTIRLTESELVSMIKRVINEQSIKGNISPELPLGCGDSGLPKGNVPKAKQIAQSFINAIKGLDISGSGQKIIEQNLNQMRGMSLNDFNEVLRQYCSLPKSWESESLYYDLGDEFRHSFRQIVDPRKKDEKDNWNKQELLKKYGHEVLVRHLQKNK